MCANVRPYIVTLGLLDINISPVISPAFLSGALCLVRILAREHTPQLTLAPPGRTTLHTLAQDASSQLVLPCWVQVLGPTDGWRVRVLQARRCAGYAHRWHAKIVDMFRMWALAIHHAALPDSALGAFSTWQLCAHFTATVQANIALYMSSHHVCSALHLNV